MLKASISVSLVVDAVQFLRLCNAVALSQGFFWPRLQFLIGIFLASIRSWF